MTNLTTLEKDVLINGFGNNYFNDREENGVVWSNSIIDHCEKCTINQLSGVVSSLVKKGIMRNNGDGNESTIGLTEKGKKVFLTLY